MPMSKEEAHENDNQNAHQLENMEFVKVASFFFLLGEMSVTFNTDREYWSFLIFIEQRTDRVVF